MIKVKLFDFGNFENVIKKAKIACKNSKQNIEDHFGDITEMVKLGLNRQKEFPSWELSRYACYLIIIKNPPLDLTKGGFFVVY